MTSNALFNALFHSSQNTTRKLASKTFIQTQYLQALGASVRVGFCDEWKRGFNIVYTECAGALQGLF